MLHMREVVGMSTVGPHRGRSFDLSECPCTSREGPHPAVDRQLRLVDAPWLFDAGIHVNETPPGNGISASVVGMGVAEEALAAQFTDMSIDPAVSMSNPTLLSSLTSTSTI